MLSPRLVNSLRVHFLTRTSARSPTRAGGDPAVDTPPGTAPRRSTFPRKTTVGETLYYNTARHDIKLGGDFSYSRGSYESHVNEPGPFTFTTDLPFDATTRATWPILAGHADPRGLQFASSQIALYAQDNWRIADRFRLNLGLRYDFDTDLRHKNFYRDLLANPPYAGIENFVSDDRGNDTNNLQPRVGATWDVFGNARLVGARRLRDVRHAQPAVFQMMSQDKTLGCAVRIEDPIRLSRYPDINAILGGQSLSEYVSAGGVRSLYLLATTTCCPTSTTSRPAPAGRSTATLARRRLGARRGPQAARLDRSQPAGQRRDQRAQPAAGTPASPW